MGALSSKRMTKNPEMLKLLIFLESRTSSLNFGIESNIKHMTYNYNDTCDTIAKAIMKGTPLCLLNDEVIELPTPQRAGTHFQRWTYALLKAREIVDTIPNTKA